MAQWKNGRFIKPTVCVCNLLACTESNFSRIQKRSNERKICLEIYRISFMAMCVRGSLYLIQNVYIYNAYNTYKNKVRDGTKKKKKNTCVVLSPRTDLMRKSCPASSLIFISASDKYSRILKNEANVELREFSSRFERSNGACFNGFSKKITVVQP